MKRWFTNLAIAVLLCGASGCATVGSDPRDPFETFNRHMYTFNEGLDQDVLKPISTAYKEVVPGPVRGWVRNFFSNLGDLWNGANNLLQGKFGDTVVDWARFAFNSTWGVLGINDVATEMGLEKHDEDFGQTLGVWGMEDGNYHVWPIFGSRTSRDTLGSVVDWFGDPVTYVDKGVVRWTARGVRVVSNRADLLDASRILEEAALDKYVFQRDAYLQRRRSQIYDGNPPRAAREAPIAEEQSETKPAAASAAQAGPAAAAPAPASAGTQAAPQAQPAAPGATEAAIRLLESPAAAPTSGG
ncbi:MAG: VacJ family lipoprotein [Burkholderiales bacterium]|nr:VacJ family lipoprotein [Burkholderiales bacterium]